LPVTAPAPTGPTLNIEQFPPKQTIPDIPTIADTRAAPSPKTRATNGIEIEATITPLKKEPGESTGEEEGKVSLHNPEIEAAPAAASLPAVSTSRRGSKVASPIVTTVAEARERSAPPIKAVAATATPATATATAAPPAASVNQAAAAAPSRSNRLRDAGGASNGGSHASSESGAGSGSTNAAATAAAPSAATTGERVSTREKRRRESRDIGQAAVAEARKLSTAGLAAAQASTAAIPAPPAPQPREKPQQEEKKRSDRAAKAEEEEEEEEEPTNVEEEGEEEGDEPRYCYCNEVSYGEMVACDNENCVRQWFHLRCVGLKEAPTTAKWYCDECKTTMKESRRSRPNSRRE
jgi:hypothetical protein